MIADAYIFVFAPFESLHILHDWGMLDRELTLLRAFAARYERVIVMTYGSRSDHDLMGLLPENCALVCNEKALETAEYLGTVPGRLSDMTPGIRTAVVRTHQMWHGDVAVNIADLLRARGIRTGLIARCGYVWSQFFARSHGPAHPRSVEARQVEGEVCRAADVVVATTQRMLDDLCWAHGVDPSRTALIPNFVLDERPPAPAEGRTRSEILYAGRFTPQKRLDLLIDAVALLPAELGARLRLIGNGELEADLRGRAATSGIDAVFEPRMPHRAMIRAMDTCGVYAQTSAYEGHPRTVIEAMSTGAPTLVTDTDGQGPEVTDGVTGLKVGSDPGAIAAGLRRLITDRELADRVGRAGAERVRDRYGFSALLPLEFAVQADALERAGKDAGGPSGGVRFGHPLLHAEASDAFAAWQRGLECFARRMDASQREGFLGAMREELDRLRDRSWERPAKDPNGPETGQSDLCAV